MNDIEVDENDESKFYSWAKVYQTLLKENLKIKAKSLKVNNRFLEISTLKSEKKNEKIENLKNDHNCILEKNKSPTIEIERLRRDLASKNVIFIQRLRLWM